MTTLGSSYLKIADIVRRSKPDGSLAIITESQNQINGLAERMPWREGDLPAGTYATDRVALPSFDTINPNGTVALGKSVTSQVLEPIEHIGKMSEVEDLVATYGASPVAAKRADEAMTFYEGGKQTVSDRLLNGNGTTTAGQINGILTRYASSTATNGRNVILGGALGGQTDCMTIVMMKMGENNAYCFYPQGSKAGLQSQDYGRGISEPSSTTRKIVWREYFRWSFGLAVPDWTSIACIRNIDKSLSVTGAGTDLYEKMTIGWHCLSRNGSGVPLILMNTTTRAILDIQARNAVGAGGQLSYKEVDGKVIEHFRDMPIMLEDKLSEAETAIS